MSKLVVTIDGPAASGKSTAACLLAERLGASFLDTGAMYRAVTLAVMQAGVDLSSGEKVLGVLSTTKFEFSSSQGLMVVSINGVDVTERIRQADVTANAHYIASSAKVREKLVQMQREFAGRQEKIITEGRDQGTVVFGDADVKIFLTAAGVERAKRRQAELVSKGEGGDFERIKKAIEERDRRDESRAVGPLKPAEDAVVVDTTDSSIEEVVEKLYSIVVARSQSGGTGYSIWFRFARFCCRMFCSLFFRVSLYGKENVPDKGAFMLISNHQSYLDPLFCGVYIKRELNFMARDTLFANRFFGWLISSVGTIPVVRGQADLSAVKKIIERLKEGRGVCLFPEGTRTNDGRISSFKGGFGLLSRRGAAVIVPVVIDGAFECWPRQKKIFSPGRIAVCYGKAISVEETKSMGDKKLAEKLTDTMRQMQKDIRQKQGKELYSY